jgi:hypothetical protein
VQDLRLRDTNGTNEPKEDDPNDNSPVTRLRRAMGALHQVKQRDTYAKLLDAVRKNMGDQVVVETQQAVEFQFNLIGANATVNKQDTSKDANALSKMTADLGKYVQAAIADTSMHWSALRRVERLRYELEDYRTPHGC